MAAQVIILLEITFDWRPLLRISGSDRKCVTRKKKSLQFCAYAPFFPGVSYSGKLAELRILL